ncbi:MAG: PAS domain S-box protein [Prosthecobacter sp.]|jgi:PAS domain S-box-containing protein|uniref:PAS domain-containing sensor histidine kinase n=1 Tax=Prosthecobacter sp. TaxID=1965333 RepID=UPI001A043DC1|nr:PAS domain-containing sensor histidine kinase [Prosthecobacter sp.]MBE2287021.1 PAS domain S-box protein [Prosthecobacter sp.]
MRRASHTAEKKGAAAKTRSSKRGVELGMSLEELHELEEKAVRLEKLAKTLLNTPQQAFYLYDHHAGRFVLGEKHLPGLYGYKQGEVERRKGSWLGIVHPDDLPEFTGAHTRMMEGKGDEVQTVRVRIRRKDGHFEWILAHMRAFERDENGRVISEVGMVNIITPLVAAEGELRATQARYHGLFQCNTAGVLVFDGKFHIVDANPAVCRMLGYDRKHLLRLGVLDVIAPGARPEMHKLLRSLTTGGRPAPAMDITLERRNSGKMEAMAGATCLHDAQGSFHQGMLLLTDVTERKATEQELRREAELNRLLLDHSPVAIGLLSAEGRVVRMNAAAEKMFGYGAKEVRGKTVWALPVMDAGEIALSRQRFQELTKGAEKVTATIPIRTRDGQARHIQSETQPVTKADGTIDFFIATGVDITERHKLETEVIRVAEQEQVRIGHDLHDGVGQTLTGIASLVEALESKLHGEDQKDARRIHELVKTAIAETRRLSHGMSSAAVKNRGLAGGLNLIAETVRENFRRECLCRIEEPVPRVSRDAEIHLFRITQEATSNAIRHGGATKIRITLRRQSPNRGVLEINDNGRGFSAKSAVSRGDGIGLRVMAHRANLINGELTVEGVKNKGVRVLCRFPLELP